MRPSSLVDTGGAAERWGAVVALKPTELAKSRLGSLPDPLRRRIAWTMAVDTLTALSAVAEVLVVSDQPGLERLLKRAGLRLTVEREPGSGPAEVDGIGMNGALSHGAQLLRRRGHALVLACVGDLPALRPETVELVLQAARDHSRCFVPDLSGVGTTMLTARDTTLRPHFQGASAAAHLASGAVALAAEALGAPWTDARRDVDTEADLIEALELGLGRATTALIDPASGRPGRYEPAVVVDGRGRAGEQLVLTATGRRLRLPQWSLGDGLQEVDPGQPLHVVTASTSVLAAWT